MADIEVLSLGTSGPSVHLFDQCGNTQMAAGSTTIRKWKWLFVSGYECKCPVSNTIEFLYPWKDWTNPSICFGIFTK
jgi:hypothetical protein